MISCIYALLFLTAADQIYDKAILESDKNMKNVPHLNRLVLLSKGDKRPFYGSYKVGDTGGFPEIKAEHDIFMATSPHSVRHSKIRAYCSPTLSSTQIGKLLAEDLVPAGNFHYPKLKDSVLSSDECMIAIRKEWEIITGGPSSHTHRLRQSSTCSNSDIIGLAFQGDISVEGIFKKYAPLNDEGVPKLVIDNKLELGDLVTKHQIFAVWKTKDSKKALIWYFGQLHIFEQRKSKIMWWPLTNIDQPEKNAATILNVLRRNLGLFQDLDKILNGYSRLDSMRDMVLSVSSSVPPDKNGEVYKVMAEISTAKINFAPWVTFTL